MVVQSGVSSTPYWITSLAVRLSLSRRLACLQRESLQELRASLIMIRKRPKRPKPKFVVSPISSQLRARNRESLSLWRPPIVRLGVGQPPDASIDVSVESAPSGLASLISFVLFFAVVVFRSVVCARKPTYRSSECNLVNMAALSFLIRSVGRPRQR